MKRYLAVFYLLYICSLYISAKINTIEQIFQETYGVIGSNPCDEDPGELRALSSFSCIPSNTHRGKEYATLFIPNENGPTINVRVNLIFIQKDDGSGNFQENNEEHQALFDDVMTSLNQVMSNLVLPDSDCFHGSENDMIHDTRIRFVDHRYYIRCSALWNNNLHEVNNARLCPSSYNWYLNHINDSLNGTLSDSLMGINVYFTEDSLIYHHYWEIQNLSDTSNYWTGNSNGACSQFPSYTNLNRTSKLHFPCQYSKFWWMKNIVPNINNLSWEEHVRNWFVNSISNSLAHELGHSFYLLHPNNESYADTFYPSSNCVASIMNPSGGSPRNFLPPQEIGRMYFHAMTTNLQQFIPDDTYLGLKTLDTIVTLPQMRMYYSLSIGSSGNVTIPCDITFSPQGHIVINNGGVLSIQNASIQSVQNNWGGIVVKSGGKLILSDVSINDYDIVVKSGGCLVVEENLIISGNHSITIEEGGYLCINDAAEISLSNEFSTIVLYPNAILGCPSCGGNCISTISNIIYTGEGSIVTFEGTKYLQNTTIMADSLITGSTVFCGYNVTNTIPSGDVVVEDEGYLKIQAEEVIFTKGVEVVLGGTLEILH